jgi:N-acylneuraminate cytidylyltransferase
VSTGGALAVIPARGGSRRVPRKNIRRMHGRPLLAYSIEAALRSDLFARVVVSTDDAEIAAIARAEGADVPFLRTPALADDMTPVSRATIDAVDRLEDAGETFPEVCQLMPNCPLRTADDVVASHRQFTHRPVDAQISVARYGWQSPWWAMRREADGSLAPLFPDAMQRRSQDLAELLCPTGAVWWARTDALRRAGTFHLAGRTGWEIDWTHAIDIDTEQDWRLAEALMGQS